MGYRHKREGVWHLQEMFRNDSKQYMSCRNTEEKLWTESGQEDGYQADYRHCNYMP